MTDAILFARAVLLGLAVAAPLGPIGALCISRTLDRGFAAGIAGGLGTALADAVYATLAALGFAAFAATLSRIDPALRLGGGLFMLWLGWKSLTPAPPRAAATTASSDLAGTIAATFLLTIANPMTILTFGALFAGFGLANAPDAVSAFAVVAGVFAGSMLWWVFLSGTVALIRTRLPDGFALWVSRASGLVLILFGLWSLGTLALSLLPAPAGTGP
jgi:putative LysE/RhtB family amino acid efflux pump